MLTRPLSARRGGSERGAVLPLFAIFLPVIVLFATFVIDVGNWFEHQRHLQLQADAAALAGGSAWAYPCSPGGSVEALIESVARTYGGPDATQPAALYNAQVGGTPASRLHMLLNSQSYWNDGGTDHSDPAGSPCAAGFLDTKVTEANLPFFFPFAGSLVPAINAHARVTIEQGTTFGGASLTPLFVRDVNPTSAAVLFVDEQKKTVLASKYLDKLDPGDCQTGLICWTNVGNPATFGIARDTGVVIALSSVPRCPVEGGGACLDLPTAPDTDVVAVCQQDGVQCYWENGSTSPATETGLVYVRGYSTAGGGGPPADPVVRGVELSGDPSLTPKPDCGDGYFAVLSTDCKVLVRAKVEVGSLPPAQVKIAAFSRNCGPKNGCALTYDGDATHTETYGYWTGLVPVTALADPPTDAITLMWQLIGTKLDSKGTCAATFSDFTGGSAKNPCTGTFSGGATLQRFFSGQDQFSGPIRSVTLYNADTSPSFAGLGANAYPVGSSHTLYVAVALAGGTATSTEDPGVQLRIVTGSGTNQLAVDCGVGNFREQLTQGCFRSYSPPTGSIDYTLNTHLDEADPCSAYTAPSFFQNPNPPPYECVPPVTGNVMNQFGDGLAGRILNGGNVCTGSGCPTTCPAKADGAFVPGADYWNDPSTAFGFPSFDKGDPRIILIFMVPFGAFRGTGTSTLVPIVHFGAFYVTGWGGQGHQNEDPCNTTNPPPGYVVGHFISFVTPSNTGGGSGDPWDPSGTTPGVAVLTD